MLFTIIRDRVQELVQQGKTLAQIKAAKPTADYDPRYDGNPSWTADNFIDIHT